MILLIVGTRPEIIKLAPVVWELERRQIPYRVLFTHQSFSPQMGAEFLEELKYQVLNVLSDSRTYAAWGVEKAFSEMIGVTQLLKPRLIVAEGDTHSTGLAAMTAVSMGIKFAHVEAGLRSNDGTMREEQYRRMADEAAQLLFLPCGRHLHNVVFCLGKKFIVGNTIADMMAWWTKKMPKPDVRHDQVLITLHRQELITDASLLQLVLQALANELSALGLKAIFPCHPHTKKFLPLHLENSECIEVVQPFSQRVFIKKLRESALVLTDSGGVQEEACILGIPAGIIRQSNERWETIEMKAAILMTPQMVAGGGRLCQEVLTSTRRAWEHPYGKDVGKKIADVLEEHHG